MPRPRFYRLPRERQRDIIVAAGKALGTGGYEGVSLNRVLEQVGLSKGAAYYYFDSKDDLIATVCLALWDHVLKRQSLDPASLTKESFWPSLSKVSLDLADSVNEERWIASAVKLIWSLPPAARKTEPLAGAFNTVIAWFAALLQRGRELGLVRTDLPQDLLLSLIVAMDEAADRWMF
ncbi:MAG TPA: TetR/AcrR family transcriptional regulator, partial [Polyangiaceae bacterium]|nr:TetR/AcrR family transcriptional regulator [Polyangiaceae bacterium]